VVEGGWNGKQAGEVGENMQVSSSEQIIGRQCTLLKPVRDRQGHMRFNEKPKILREVNNLNRRMFLVQFDDGSTTFLFPDEVNIE
jgi:hypothetical protein